MSQESSARKVYVVIKLDMLNLARIHTYMCAHIHPPTRARAYTTEVK